jgi:hypothetical protein
VNSAKSIVSFITGTLAVDIGVIVSIVLSDVNVRTSSLNKESIEGGYDAVSVEEVNNDILISISLASIIKFVANEPYMSMVNDELGWLSAIKVDMWVLIYVRQCCLNGEHSVKMEEMFLL